MARPKKKNSVRLNINAIIESVINEFFDSKIETTFKEIFYSDYVCYQFKTNSNTLYDLEFHYSEEPTETVLYNNNVSDTLGNILGVKKNHVDCFDIAFSLTDIHDKENPDEFEAETNKHEYVELMARISYIIEKILKKYNKDRLFIVPPSRRNKVEIYERIFNNQFSDTFDLYYDESERNKKEKSLFIIRK